MDVASNRSDPVLAIGKAMRCRHCGTPLQHSLIALGMSPLCESFLTETELNEPEPYYPLHVRVCHACWLVQLPEFVRRLIAGNQFDTIYHEHFSYFSLGAMIRLAAAHGLALIDVETLPTHGGSLRLSRPSRLAPPRLDSCGPYAGGGTPGGSRGSAYLF